MVDDHEYKSNTGTNADVCNGFTELCNVSGNDDHIGAFFRKLATYALAHAFRAARDEDRLCPYVSSEIVDSCMDGASYPAIHRELVLPKKETHLV